MILAAHELVGAAVGEKVHNPWLIIILSLALHFALDTLRHGEYLDRKSTIKDTFWKVTLDASVGLIIIIFYILYRQPESAVIRNIFLGAFVSVFPDSLTFLYWKLRIKFFKKPFEFHFWLHKYPPFSPERAWTLRNGINDVLISAAAIAILFVK